MSALTGIRVVDLTRVLAGPFCTLMLADMGAEVIKVESPGAGDPVRHQGAMKDGFSWYFAQFNRNKKSITLDLRGEDGKAALARLIETADVLVENYRPGVLADMGFGPERLEALNPRLIVASINGFGSTGPYVARPAFDFIAQAMSGFMSVTGEPDGPPMRAGPPMSDMIAGLYAAFGVVSALVSRGGPGTGLGQTVESTLTGGMISMLAFMSAEYFATGNNPARTGNDHGIVAPYGLFTASDGAVAVAPSTDVFVRRFLGAIGLESLMKEPRFATNADRMANRAELNARIDAAMQGQPVDHWIEVINAAGCPCGRVMTLADVFADPQVQAQDMELAVDHPGRGTIRMTGFPVKLGATPCTVVRPAPELGQHTHEILSAAGLDDAEIARAAGSEPE
ncbi:MAG: CoA transferase [Rhodospirillaceae bacterium]